MAELEDVIQRAVKAATTEWLEKHATPPIANRLMSTQEAANYLGCSTNHVTNLAAAGEIPVFRWQTSGERRKPYFDRIDLDRIIEQRKSTDAA